MVLKIKRAERKKPPIQEIDVPCAVFPPDKMVVEFGTHDSSTRYCGFAVKAASRIILVSREDAVALAKAILEEYGEEYRTETDEG